MKILQFKIWLATILRIIANRIYKIEENKLYIKYHKIEYVPVLLKSKLTLDIEHPFKEKEILMKKRELINAMESFIILNQEQQGNEIVVDLILDICVNTSIFPHSKDTKKHY